MITYGEPAVHLVTDLDVLEPACGTGNFESYATDRAAVDCPDCRATPPLSAELREGHRPYRLYDHTEVPWDELRPDETLVVQSRGWCCSKSYQTPDDVTLNVYYYPYCDGAPIGPGIKHPLDGTKYDSVTAASRAAYEAGILVAMRYEEVAP